MEIGDTIREAREERKLTQEELAALVKATQSQVADWERGRYEPSVRRLFAIADALDCELVYRRGRLRFHCLKKGKK